RHADPLGRRLRRRLQGLGALAGRWRRHRPRQPGRAGLRVPAGASPLASVEAALERAAEVNPLVNALCLVDAEAARVRARELEARLERGEDTGPLTGWTFTVKDAMR